MQYLLHIDASNPSLKLIGDEHHYLFKVRRHKNGDEIAFRNGKDGLIFIYKIVNIDKKSASLELLKSYPLEIKAYKNLHIGWCMIEVKNIEKVLPILNELGVAKISFISCDRSQTNYKLDMNRIQKILTASSQQCGRSNFMEIEHCNSLKEFRALYPKSVALNFSNNHLNSQKIETIVIGCEGGFSPKEVALFGEDIVGFDTPLILKSESAVCAVASKILI
ncbi:MAG: 16S rRNA (uracil(1498)-N(3))-methyltransferase [Campylobacterales bacterium]|nr:16S rRNA (uracil(1498)-N(3))-methyltransferase [Campylobacterota bacterium]MBD3842225.1 16S rRNA (uracil(1498)-N(3))-methyltransferase [Campylobacterales bacterium]